MLGTDINEETAGIVRTASKSLACCLTGMFFLININSAEAENFGETFKGYSYWGTGNYLKVFRPMKQSDWKLLARKNIQSIETIDESNELLFNSPNNFPHLLKATLDSYHNILQLIALANNYPELRTLIYKEGSLVPSDFSSLAKFKILSTLSLQGYITDPKLFTSNLPISLNSLTLDQTAFANLSNPPKLKLPVLSRLVINHETISSDFFKSLDSPDLRKIEFNHVNLLPESLSALRNMSKLMKVTIADSTYDPEDLHVLSKNIPNVIISAEKTTESSSSVLLHSTGDYINRQSADNGEKYMSAVREKINKHQLARVCNINGAYPRLAFRIWKDGHISNLRVLTSGGYGLDEAFLKAVRAACPFDSPPCDTQFVDTSFECRSFQQSTPHGIIRKF